MSEDAEIIKLLSSLGPDDKRRVLDFMHKLVHGRPRGTPAAELRELAGCISHEDAQKMLEAMDGCRQIDLETWDPRYSPFDNK
ncbi:MAG TPA: hypothetical protein VFJ16_00420 [Longimicrobium sp.]|nr:hypothetical protein [Longimicrobium sp.]